MAIKINLGKYQLSDPLENYFNEAIALYQLSILPIQLRHAAVIAALPAHYRDPFDRMLIAQAMVENLAIVSADTAFDSYPVTRIW